MYFDSEYRIPVVGGELWTAIRKGDDQRPPLVVIHGGPGSNHLYLSNFSEHMPGRTLIYYDQRDSGYSSRSGDPRYWLTERFCDDLAEVIDFYQLNQFHLLGSSWGGTLALIYALRHDPRLLSLILAGPLISGPRWNSDNRQYVSALKEPWRSVLLRGDVSDDNYAEAVEQFNRQHMLRLDTAPDYVQLSNQLQSKELYNYLWGDADYFGNGLLANIDLSPQLSLVQVPTLFIVGEYDCSSPQETLKKTS